MSAILTSSVSRLAPALPGPQAGLIRTDSSDYFIEPLERGQQEKEAGGRTHVVYRREAVQQEWAEPHGDLHNEGRLWAGGPTSDFRFKLSVLVLSFLICEMGLCPKGRPKQERSPSGLNGQLELAKILGLERATRALNRGPQDSNVSEDVLWLSRSRRLNGY